jgi:hypothetical protein
MGREIVESDRSYQSVLVLPIGMQVCFLSLSAFDAQARGVQKGFIFILAIFQRTLIRFFATFMYAGR